MFSVKRPTVKGWALLSVKIKRIVKKKIYNTFYFLNYSLSNISLAIL